MMNGMDIFTIQRLKHIKKIKKLATEHNYCKEQVNGICMYPHCGCLFTENGFIDPETGEVIMRKNKDV